MSCLLSKSKQYLLSILIGKEGSVKKLSSLIKLSTFVANMFPKKKILFFNCLLYNFNLKSLNKNSNY